MKLGDQTGHENDVGRFNALFDQDSMGMAILAIDPIDSRWLRANQKFCDMLGYTREELLQMTPADISPTGEQDIFTEYSKKLRRGELNSLSREKRYLRKNGTAVRTNTWLSAGLDPEGKPTEIISVIQDITENRLADESLVQNEPLLSLINNLPAAIFFKDIAGRYQTVNQTFCDWYDIDQKQVLGKFPNDFFSPDEAEIYSRHDHRVLQKAEIVEAETQVTYPDGKVRWILIIKFPVLSRSGEIMGVGAINLDVSDRKHAENSLKAARNLLELRVEERTSELRESEKLFKQAAQIASLGHFVWDEVADRCLFASDEYARILGVTVDEVLKQYNCHEQDIVLVHPDDRERVLASYADFRRQAGSLDIEYRVIRPDNEERHIREMGEPVLDHRGRLMRNVGILQDITEQKQAENALKEVLEELEARVAERTAELEQRNIALEQFTYTVSHDLKSPLVTVNSFIGLLSKDLQAGNDKSVAEDMQHIVSAVSQMGRSLDDLLELSRVGHVVNEPQPVSLSQLGDEVVNILQGLLVDGDVEIEIAPDMPVVLADKQRIGDVMQNLLENAIKFRGEEKKPRISVDAKIQDNLVQCRIKDNGIGIDPHYHDKVFGLFDRLNPKVEGSGVGLALVKRIIEVHNGKVWIESEGIGQGTQVYFTLPAASGETR